MKKRYLLLSLLSCLGVASLGIATTFSNNVGQNVFGSDCSHDGNHYVAGPNYVEFWTCCKCHETFLTKPAHGKFVDNDPSAMVGGVPLVATIEKDIERLVPDIGTLSNYEKVKNANILYTLNSKISSLTDAEKDKLHIDTFNSAKANYENYITPVYGFNDTDTISPLNVYNSTGEITDDSQINSITKINKESYGQMYDVEFKPDAGIKNHFMSLDKLKGSLSSFDSLAFIAINDVTPWGAVGKGANVIHLRNNWKLLKAGELPGWAETPAESSYVKGENLVEVSSSEIISTSGKNEFSDFQIDFQNTWDAATNNHNHLYLTGLFGLKNIDVQGMADKVIASITKAKSLKLTSNEIAAQATLLVDAARKQYEALPSAAKTLVTNYADLETLETTLTSYTYMLKTTSMSIKQGEEVYNDIDVTYKYDPDYGNITHLKCKKQVEKSIDISFGFSDGGKAFAGYSKIIIFLRTPNLTSGISGVIDCGNPYLWLETGTIKTDWVANTNQDLKSTTSQKLNGIRLTNNIIPSWATGYGELEFTSFVLIKDGVTYTESH